MIGMYLKDGSSKFDLTPGENYLVLGVTFIVEDGFGKVLYQTLNDAGGISHVPASLFELVDNRCSAFWVARYDADGSLLLWPKEFFSGYFHDELSDGDEAVTSLFRVVVDKMTKEAAAGE